MDLSNWEYFTTTFDHAGTLGEIFAPTSQQRHVGATLDECSLPITARVGDNGTKRYNHVRSPTCTNASLTVYVSNAPYQRPGSDIDDSNHLSMAATEPTVHSQNYVPRQCLLSNMQEMSCDPVEALHNMGACVYRTEFRVSAKTTAMNESGRTSATDEFLDSIQARRQEIMNTTRSIRASSFGSQTKPSLNSHETPEDSPGSTDEYKPPARTYLHPTHVPLANASTRDKTSLLAKLHHPKLCKPLKVYNYFYRDERDNIVNGMQNHGDPLPPPVSDFSQSKYEHLLHQRWYVRVSLCVCTLDASYLVDTVSPCFPDDLQVRRPHQAATAT
jgi:hypothetical protein